MTTSRQYFYVRTLDHTDIDAAAALVGRGMVDNPINLAAYRGDEASRARRSAQLVRTRLATSSAFQMAGVEQGGSLVGFAAWARPGRCQPSAAAKLRLLARIVTFGPGVAARVLTWTNAWADHDPDEQHVHLGPVAVDRDRRGQGIGGLMLLRHTASLDSMGAVGYLETDRPEAVGFYARFGYAVVAEANVLGVRCWFMRRPSAA